MELFLVLCLFPPKKGKKRPTLSQIPAEQGRRGYISAIVSGIITRSEKQPSG